MKGVAPLIKGVSFDALLADKAFDADWLLEDLDERGATAVIPPKANRKIQRDYDVEVYKWRHLVENYFAKIKEFRRIATRYDKTDCSYAASWYLVAALPRSQDERTQTLAILKLFGILVSFAVARSVVGVPLGEAPRPSAGS